MCQYECVIKLATSFYADWLEMNLQNFFKMEENNEEVVCASEFIKGKTEIVIDSFVVT